MDRIDDLPRTRRRRRWLVVLALLCLLPLAVPCSIAWRFYGPLNDAEQRLVGTWRSTAGPDVMTFHSDRTVTDRRFPPGAWWIRGNTLYGTTANSFVSELVESMLLKQVSESSEITFEDDNSISLSNPVNGATSRWQRVTTQPSSAN